MSLILALALGSPTSHPLALDVADFCQFVAEKVTETDPSKGTRYVYQTRLYAAAGIDPNQDTKDVISDKMRAFWLNHQDDLICNVLNSTVENRHILRLAIDRVSTEFIDDVARRWKADLNYVDKKDGGTALDFVDCRINKGGADPAVRTLLRYRGILEGAGAKRARALDLSQC